ncbi:hypothetical protein OG500_09520 [Kitasatospora sp. NBC_01250]|uniref:hypothetical protein n=1 Tax=Kitasatospora sp. NBC_01250 TaxID=2903571 RepID=UPI002E332024|nr:hypothetical protein [Kitasatospora sp. NBC_01250]
MKKITKRVGTLAVATGVAFATLLTGATSAFALPGGPSERLSTSTPNFGCGAAWYAAQTTLKFQCDGNLVLYRNSDGHAMWATGTYGTTNNPTILDFSHNGDIEMLRTEDWGTGVFCDLGSDNPAPGGTAVIQDDGNFVIYNTAGQATWATGTYNNQQGTVHACQ